MRKDREMSEEFRLMLKEYKEKSGMTLTKLADLVEVDKSYLSRLLQGQRRSPGVPIMRNIAKKLEIPNSEILRFLEIDECEEDMDLFELLLSKNFLIEGQEVDNETRETIVEILQIIISSKWNNESLLGDCFLLVGKVKEFKAQLNA